MDDGRLLKEYAATGSEEAFRELVDRHIGLVFAAARRQVRDPHLAEDVTQAVFVILARKAGGIRGGGELAGWLLKTTRYVAIDALRMQMRRQHHERRAAQAIAETHDATVSDWREIMPLLDEAMAGLGRLDRSAIALRYLEGRSIENVAEAMAISSNAAQKRIARALGKLRKLLSSRGVALSAAGLGSALAGSAADGAGAGAAASIVDAAMGHAPSSGGAALARQAMRRTAMTKMTVGAAVPGLLLALGAGVAAVATRGAGLPASPPQRSADLGMPAATRESGGSALAATRPTADGLGPVVELTLQDSEAVGTDGAADLETGRLFSPPRRPRNGIYPTLLAWEEQNGVDLRAAYRSGDEVLVGSYMRTVRVSDSFTDGWDGWTAETTRRKVRQGNVERIAQMHPARRLPSTWLVETRHGVVGIVQIVASEPQKWVKFRYRMAVDRPVSAATRPLASAGTIDLERARMLLAQSRTPAVQMQMLVAQGDMESAAKIAVGASALQRELAAVMAGSSAANAVEYAGDLLTQLRQAFERKDAETAKAVMAQLDELGPGIAELLTQGGQDTGP